MSPETANCLEAITAYIAANGRSPRYADLQAVLNCSSSVVGRHIERLEAEGRIRRTPRRFRSIELIGPHGATPSIVAAAWRVVDAWRENRLTGLELGELLQTLDPELFG